MNAWVVPTGVIGYEGGRNVGEQGRREGGKRRLGHEARVGESGVRAQCQIKWNEMESKNQGMKTG